MDWVLRSPQMHSTFSRLCYVQADGYHAYENCDSALEEILQNILAEDKNLRNYRRNINFGQNIQKDLIPLLIHAKEDTTVDLVIRILINLTLPKECLLDVKVTARTDFGRHIIYDINKLLASAKVAFTELQTSKVVIDFLKKNIDVEPNKKLSEKQLNYANNCLLLLRNILYIPEYHGYTTCNGSHHFVQNQIIWNIFSQSIDKVIIKAMTISDTKFFGVTMVQLFVVLYKDQDLKTLHKLMNIWHDTSISESSEDNESNTSTPDRGSNASSMMLTSSDSTSNSADSTENGPGNDFRSSVPDYYVCSIPDDKSAEVRYEDHIKLRCEMTDLANLNDCVDQNNKKQLINETTDYRFRTQIGTREFVSISSNNESLPLMKSAHQKPHNANQPPNEHRPSTTLQQRKRKKIAKRVKANIINIQGLSRKAPADDDISNVIQEFTVDFLLRGYNSLVQALHKEIRKNRELKKDASVFWLVAYFLRFATEMELDLEFIDSVLCFDIISYLINEGVNICEQLELAIKFDDSDLISNLQKQHMVVSSIREFVQAIHFYGKIQLPNEADHESLQKLQIKMSETQDLSSLLVLLLRQYNPSYHSKEYLKDLVVTNHILLILLDNAMKIPEYNCSTEMIDHIRKFATPDIMAQYGLLFKDFYINGEYVNDCIFTLMHHVGANEDSLDTLFQPNILMTFENIWKSKFEICDDWTDLLTNVISTFTKEKETLRDLFLKHNGKDNKLLLIAVEDETSDSIKTAEGISKISNNNTASQAADNKPQEKWTVDEISALSWNYLQCSANSDIIDDITKQLKEENIDKSRTSVIKTLFRQNLITKNFHESLLKEDTDKNTKTVISKSLRKKSCDEEIKKSCEQLILDGRSPGLEWVQKILLDICYAKLHRQREELQSTTPVDLETKFKNFVGFINKHDDFLPIVSPVIYHSLIMQESVPLVPWNCKQAAICKDLKFLQVLAKLGFEMPVDTGRIFIRIPHVWTAEFIYKVAGKIGPIDTSKLTFSACDLSNIENSKTKEYQTSDVIKDGSTLERSDTDNFYTIHKQNLATMVNFTPRSASTFTSNNATEQLPWYEYVKKARQCKLTLNLESTSEAITDTNTAGLVAPLLQPTASLMMPTTSIKQTNTSVMLPSTPFMLPTICDMQRTSSVIRTTSSVIQTTSSAILRTSSIMMPTTSVKLPSSVMQPTTFSIKQETAPDNVKREDCCKSVCETVSDASDLTRIWDGETTSSGPDPSDGSSQRAGEPTAHIIKSGKTAHNC